MNAKQKRTLAAIFTRPTPGDVRWNDVVSLMKALGSVDQRRAGSRVGFTVHGWTLVTHKPHPGSQLSRASVRDIRDFLQNAGVLP